MTHQSNNSLPGRSTHRSKGLAFLGALSLGLALLFVCLALLAVPLRAETEPRGQTSWEEKAVASTGYLSRSSLVGHLTPSSIVLADHETSADDFEKFSPLKWSDNQLTEVALARTSLPFENSARKAAPVSVSNQSALQPASSPVNSSIRASNVVTPNLTLAWSSVETDDTYSVSWGDWDSDGDLDLAAANSVPYQGQSSRLYENNDGAMHLAWSLMRGFRKVRLGVIGTAMGI